MIIDVLQDGGMVELNPRFYLDAGCRSAPVARSHLGSYRAVRFEGGPARREKPCGDLLRTFGVESGRPALDSEDDVAYCARVFGVEADPEH